MSELLLCANNMLPPKGWREAVSTCRAQHRDDYIGSEWETESDAFSYSIQAADAAFDESFIELMSMYVGDIFPEYVVYLAELAWGRAISASVVPQDDFVSFDDAEWDDIPF